MENKKNWVTPSIQTLDIKKDTFSGSKHSAEHSSGEPAAHKPDKGTTGASSTRGR